MILHKPLAMMPLMTFFCVFIIHNYLWLFTAAFPTHLKADPGEQQKQAEPKYFFEAGATVELERYDIRYFSGVVTSEEKLETLQHLIRSYMTVFQNNKIETWIAHGTLLGWWWNGKILPWDGDLDTQVSDSTLKWLATNMNMTIHDFKFTESVDSYKSRQYLLDVNPYAENRSRGNGNNVIDARWIDTKNRLFIDITGLSEVEPGILSCRNNYRYRVSDIYPLRESKFEGVTVKTPYNFKPILIEEYSNRALESTTYYGYHWVPEQREW
ncbi:Protein MNN4, partial [Erysiphe neolycopersici]